MLWGLRKTRNFVRYRYAFTLGTSDLLTISTPRTCPTTPDLSHYPGCLYQHPGSVINVQRQSKNKGLKYQR